VKLLWLALALGACAYTEDQFREDADEATCAWKADCFGGVSDDECLADAEASWSGPPEGCVYDEEAAQDCVDQLERLECPVNGEETVLPEVCDWVWDC
jgi:hypothetical protein